MQLPFLLLLSLFFLAPSACAPPPPAATESVPAANDDFDPIAALLDEPESDSVAPAPLERMGYTIQVGAFANLDNAVALERLLDRRGLDAYYFRHESGLYKVRFGNHPSYQAARAEAVKLKEAQLIDAFYIVEPDDYSVAQIGKSGRGDLRLELVATAKRFIGVPYRWGGSDHEDGFDCSGLTMVCYRLNGLNLPRNSRSQFDAGRRVSKEKLAPGDLVFFATKGGKRVTHVGMYIGEGRFIHSPRTGQTVRIENLSQPFFARTYVGSRSFL
jgi:cell wall-associated NlpC family hydrolase